MRKQGRGGGHRERACLFVKVRRKTMKWARPEGAGQGGVGEDEQRVRKKWAHPSIHILGLWGNLDPWWSFFTLPKPLSGPAGMKGRPGPTSKRILNASAPRSWGRGMDREAGGGEG